MAVERASRAERTTETARAAWKVRESELAATSPADVDAWSRADVAHRAALAHYDRCLAEHEAARKVRDELQAEQARERAEKARADAARRGSIESLRAGVDGPLTALLAAEAHVREAQAIADEKRTAIDHVVDDINAHRAAAGLQPLHPQSAAVLVVDAQCRAEGATPAEHAKRIAVACGADRVFWQPPTAYIGRESEWIPLVLAALDTAYPQSAGSDVELPRPAPPPAPSSTERSRIVVLDARPDKPEMWTSAPPVQVHRSGSHETWAAVSKHCAAAPPGPAADSHVTVLESR